MNESNKNQVIDLKEIFFAMLKSIWLIILLGIVGYVGMYFYAKETEVPTYTTSVSLYVKNTTNKTTLDSISTTEIAAGRFIASTYIAILNDDIVMDTIGDKLLEKYSPDELSQNQFVVSTNADGSYHIESDSVRSKLTFEQIDETELINVSVTTPSPIISADMCTYIVEYAPEVLTRVVGAGAVENVGEVNVPQYSDGSKVPTTARAGMLAGIVIAVIIIYLRYIFDNTVTSGEVVKVKYDLPMLGEIPYYDVTGTGKKQKNKTGLIARLKFKIKKEDEKIERLVRSNIKDVEVPFVVTEAYNTFRNNMFFALSTTKNNIAIISSSLAGEGKSTSAANLCISIGETESRVLLIDADLRRPTQHKIFKLNNKKGLSSVLSNIEKFESAVNKNVVGNLDVLTAGPIPPNPSQMLVSENMTKLIEKVSPLYDYVIIDTSPINIVSDALVLSKMASGIVLVTKYGITTYDQVDKIIQSVNFVGSNILGVVINSINVESGIYGKKDYKYYRYKSKYNYTYSDANDNNK